MAVKPTAPATLTWTGVTARRMARHALTEPLPTADLPMWTGTLSAMPCRRVNRTWAAARPPAARPPLMTRRLLLNRN
jgi:hypothetical protein